MIPAASPAPDHPPAGDLPAPLSRPAFSGVAWCLWRRSPKARALPRSSCACGVRLPANPEAGLRNVSWVAAVTMRAAVAKRLVDLLNVRPGFRQRDWYCGSRLRGRSLRRGCCGYRRRRDRVDRGLGPFGLVYARGGRGLSRRRPVLLLLMLWRVNFRKQLCDVL